MSKKARLESESPIFNIKVPSTVHAKSNGRMAFAPLFQQEQQKNVDRFLKMVKPPPTNDDSLIPNVRSTGRSGPNVVDSRKVVSDLSTILGLPELPFEPPLKATMSLSNFDDDENNEIDYDEYSEDGKLQLLPKKSAGKSVARFHKDREQPDHR